MNALHVALLSTAVFAGSAAGAEVLRFVELHRDGENGVEALRGARAVAVSPDGAHVYVVAQADYAVAIFARDPDDGGLSFLGSVVQGIGGVTGLRVGTAIAISPDGAHVYVGADADSSVAVFERDSVTGALAFVEAQQDEQGGVTGMLAPRGVTVSPDGAHLYVASIFDGGIVRFARSAETGALVYQGTTVENTMGPSSIAFSTDGADAYVASQGAGVSHFRRDPTSGDLSFVAVEQPTFGTFRQPRIVAVAPDDDTVYAASLADDSVAAFERAEVTGELSLLDLYRHGENGILGLERANWVSVSPDGQWVFATGEFGDSLSAFRRMAGGALTLEQGVFQRDDDVDGLDFPLSIATSPDGRDLYVAADGGGGTVAHFAVPTAAAAASQAAALVVLGVLRRRACAPGRRRH